MAGHAGLRRLRFSFFLDEPARVLPAFGRMSLVGARAFRRNLVRMARAEGARGIT
jgi:hypothetical protein